MFLLPNSVKKNTIPDLSKWIEVSCTTRLKGQGCRYSGETIPKIPEHLWADLSSVVSHLSLLKGLVPRRCQHAKNVMLADRSGLMDVRIALVNSLLNLLKGQVDFCGGIQITD